MTGMLHLAPVPRRMTCADGVYTLAPDAFVLIDDRTLWASLRSAADRGEVTRGLRFCVGACAGKPAVVFSHNAALAHEAYTLTVGADGVSVGYGDPAGAFYAMSTLVQVTEECGGALPYLSIDDAPAFPTRGYMLDIGRNKVPTLAEMKKLCDWLASVKINHVELYIEGIPFEYPSFPHMWQGREVLTAEDVLSLDEFCRTRFIELVPTQNNFGHMDNWLRSAYRDLAECPESFTFGGGFLPDPRCLNPLDPRSEALVHQLADDFLPCFSSDKYNICCDETLELGQGHAKEAVETLGKGRVYLDFLKKVCEGGRRHGKTLLFWDDILIDYPELLPELPQDVIALEWGYMANQPSEAHCKQLRDCGVRYYVCPGTGAWNTLLGKTNQMIPNIRNAAAYGLKYGAEGLLNTDWGDCGHPQAISTSWPGILYGAAMSWSPDESRDMNLAAVLDAHVFMDKAGVMGRLSLDAGNYFEVEKVIPHNITSLFLILISGLDAVNLAEPFTAEDYDRIDAYLAGIDARLNDADLRCADAALVLREYRNSVGILRCMTVAGKYMRCTLDGDEAGRRRHLTALSGTMPTLINEWRRLWLARNKLSYLDETDAMMRRIGQQALEKLREMK